MSQNRSAPDRRTISRRGLLIGGGAVVATAALGFTTVQLLSGVDRGDSASGSDPTPSTPPVPLTPIEAMLAARPFTIAHRGGSLDWPESSRYAYDRAVEFGVDALEMSVVRTSDGVWFGAHDAELDRAAGTTGFVVRDRPWADVQKLSIAPPPENPDQPSQPFMRVEEFIDAYHRTHALWIDPKAVHRRFYEELMSIMVGRVPTPADVFVAKCDATITEWGDLAQKHGMQSWGFYYGRNLDQDPASFENTQASWTMLGLDLNASEQQWADFAADGRPVVAHVLSKKEQRDIATELGASGLMISGVRELLG